MRKAGIITRHHLLNTDAEDAAHRLIEKRHLNFAMASVAPVRGASFIS